MIVECISKVVDGKNLSREEAKLAFDEIMAGPATSAQIASLITALRMKGETIEEIIGAVESMRSVVSAVKPNVKGDFLDVVGTGGDRKGTFNVSTCSAIVAAGVGCLVAKHGNRSVSSRSGAADVLFELGVNIEADNVKNAQLIEKIGIAFIFAQKHHPAMKHAAGPRKEIGIRTIFNVLGPLTNPAGAQTMLLGVYDQSLAKKLAGVLAGLGMKKALVVHGSLGEDELSISGQSVVFEVENGEVKEYLVKPQDFGLRVYPEKNVVVENSVQSAQAIRSVLEGKERGAKREIVLLNAGAAIYANGMAKSIMDGIKLAEKSIDSGAALKKLDLLVKESRA